MSSAVRLPASHGAAVSNNSRVQRSPMPLARLPCAWVWALTRPGWISLRWAEIIAGPSGAARPGAPISRIVSSSTRMSAGSAVPFSISSTRPPRIIMWGIRILLESSLTNNRGQDSRNTGGGSMEFDGVGVGELAADDRLVVAPGEVEIERCHLAVVLEGGG